MAEINFMELFNSDKKATPALVNFLCACAFREYDITDKTDRDYIVSLLYNKVRTIDDAMDVVDCLAWARMEMNEPNDQWVFIRLVKNTMKREKEYQ